MVNDYGTKINQQIKYVRIKMPIDKRHQYKTSSTTNNNNENLNDELNKNNEEEKMKKNSLNNLK